jgi:hypothetical protein
VCPGCAAARSPRRPTSASSTTPSWSAATSPLSPPPYSNRSPAHSSWTTPKGSHLLHLAQAQEGSDTLARPRSGSSRQRALSKSLQWTLDVATAGPALVTNGRQGLLAANQLGRAFFTDVYDSDTQPPNMARFQFLDQAARRFYPDWDHIADMTVDVLRTEAGRNPHDKGLHDLVGELSTRSDAFRTR